MFGQYRAGKSLRFVARHSAFIENKYANWIAPTFRQRGVGDCPHEDHRTVEPFALSKTYGGSTHPPGLTPHPTPGWLSLTVSAWPGREVAPH